MKFRKISISKADIIWARQVRERDGKCVVCGKNNFLNAHHLFGRGNYNTRFNLENGVTLCAGHHTFRNDFSAHKTPKDFRDWWREKIGEEKYKELEQLSIIRISQKVAINNFFKENNMEEAPKKVC